MSKILGLARRDLTGTSRDSILMYIVVAPLLLAAAIRFFIPAVQEGLPLTFAVTEEIGEEMISALRGHGNVQVLRDEGQVVSRVGRHDHAAGVVMRESAVHLILEGDEPPSTAEAYEVIVDRIIAPADAGVRVEFDHLGGQQPRWPAIAAAILTMTVTFLAGTVSGFHIVEEKQSAMMQAVAVSPLSGAQMLAARGAFSLGVALLTSLGAGFILEGFALNWPALVAVMLASTPLMILVVLLLGHFSSNQISAIATIKVIMPAYLTLPLVSLVLSPRWMFVLYPFPNYWQFQALQNVYASGLQHSTFAVSTALTLALGGVAFLLTARRLRAFT
ncbi:MAG: ABC transporter permease [Bacillota bacterium]